MPNYKRTMKVPDWVKQSPSDDNKKLIKKHCYNHLEGIALSGQNFLSASAEIPEFMKVLADYEPMFKEVKAYQMKTSFKFFEAVRLEIRH